MRFATLRTIDRLSAGAQARRSRRPKATIAAAVDQQSAATGNISRNIRDAASGTAEVATSITKVTQGAHETGAASSEMLASAQSLAKDGTRLRDEVARFLRSIKAA